MHAWKTSKGGLIKIEHLYELELQRGLKPKENIVNSPQTPHNATCYKLNTSIIKSQGVRIPGYYFYAPLPRSNQIDKLWSFKLPNHIKLHITEWQYNHRSYHQA